MYFHWASQTQLKNSRYTQPYETCLCYDVCVQVPGAAECGAAVHGAGERERVKPSCVACTHPCEPQEVLLHGGARALDLERLPVHVPLLMTVSTPFPKQQARMRSCLRGELRRKVPTKHQPQGPPRPNPAPPAAPWSTLSWRPCTRTQYTHGWDEEAAVGGAIRTRERRASGSYCERVPLPIHTSPLKHTRISPFPAPPFAPRLLVSTQHWGLLLRSKSMQRTHNTHMQQTR